MYEHDNYIYHSFEWKNHKYIKKIGNRYIYPSDLKRIKNKIVNKVSGGSGSGWQINNNTSTYGKKIKAISKRRKEQNTMKKHAQSAQKNLRRYANEQKYKSYNDAVNKAYKANRVASNTKKWEARNKAANERFKELSRESVSKKASEMAAKRKAQTSSVKSHSEASQKKLNAYKQEQKYKSYNDAINKAYKANKTTANTKKYNERNQAANEKLRKARLKSQADQTSNIRKHSKESQEKLRAYKAEHVGDKYNKAIDDAAKRRKKKANEKKWMENNRSAYRRKKYGEYRVSY